MYPHDCLTNSFILNQHIKFYRASVTPTHTLHEIIRISKAKT